jgi:hypothetical protein
MRQTWRCSIDYRLPSRQFDVSLITADDHFKDLPEVIFFSKKSGSLINPNTKIPADR